MPAIAFPNKKYDGYIFDCDGTLADSMPLHYRAWCAALSQCGATFHFAESLYYSWAGVSTRGVVERLNALHGTTLDPARVAHLKEEIYLQSLDQLRPVPSVRDFARTIARSHPVAIATGGWRRVVRRTLEVIGLDDIFTHIVTPEDVAHGKPAPDMFFKAAELMGVPPSRCVVFEDGQPGIEGARADGMEVVFIPTPAPTD